MAQGAVLACLAMVIAGAVALAGRVPARLDLVDYREAIVALHRPVSLDPLVERDDPATRDLGRLLYRRLLRLDDEGLPTADLATSWSVSGDGLVYRFQLGMARWSDGRPITAADVLATVAVVQSPGFADEQLSAPWKGATVRADGDRSVTVVLPVPRAAFAASLSDLPILPATSLRGRDGAALVRAAGRPMATSGPYTVAESDATHVRLVPNPYASVPPRLLAVDLRLEPSREAALAAFVAGQVDAVLATTPAEREAVAKLPGVRLHDLVTRRFVDLLLDAGRPGLDDPTVRQAIAEATDRQAIVAGPLHHMAVPQSGAIPAGISWIRRNDAPPAAPELARRALDADGWQLGPDGVRRRGPQVLEFDLAVADVAPLPEVAAELGRQLGAVGIAVHVDRIAPATFAASIIRPGAFDMALAVWDNGPDPDVSSYWRSNALPPQGANVSGLAPDPFLDQALDALATESDVALRRIAAQRVDERLAEDVPAVFLYAPKVTLAVRSAVVVHLPRAGDPADRYDEIATWARSATG